MTERIRRKSPTASMKDVVRWINDGVFRVEDGRVFKGDKELAQRVNIRNRCKHGDPRVDLWHEGKRRSCHVSALVWIANTGEGIPTGFEIHHRDEDPMNNDWDNLIAVHSLDHPKLHRLEEVPF